MNRLVVAMLLVAFVSVGCSQESGSYLSPGALPVDIPSSSGQPVPASFVTGTWTGTTSAAHGESGTLSVTFTQPPTPDQAVTASIEWTPEGTSLKFDAVVTGTIGNLMIDASNLPNGCMYHAVGSLNAAGTVITGTYTAAGPGTCTQKAGTFTLSGGSYVAPVIPPALNCTESFWQMNQGSSNANKNACENRGGIFLAEWTTYKDVCKFAPNPPGNPGADITLLASVPIECPAK